MRYRILVMIFVLLFLLFGVYEMKRHQPKLTLNDQPYLYIQELGESLPTNPSIFVITNHTPKFHITYRETDLLKENCLNVGSYLGTISYYQQQVPFIWYVLDTTCPIISLKESSLTITQGEIISEESLKSYVETKDLAPINRIEVIHEIDFDSPGIYEITYYAYDESNNRSLPSTLSLSILEAPYPPCVSSPQQDPILKNEQEIIQDYDAYFYSEDSADAWAKEQCLNYPHLYKGYLLVGDTKLPNREFVYVVYLYKK